MMSKHFSRSLASLAIVAALLSSSTVALAAPAVQQPSGGDAVAQR